MDRDRASFERTMQSLQRAFGRAVVPLAIPLGEEKGFVGVADLVTNKADVYHDDQSGKFEAVDVPNEIKEAASSWRECSLSWQYTHNNSQLLPSGGLLSWL